MHQQHKVREAEWMKEKLQIKKDLKRLSKASEKIGKLDENTVDQKQVSKLRQPQFPSSYHTFIGKKQLPSALNMAKKESLIKKQEPSNQQIQNEVERRASISENSNSALEDLDVYKAKRLARFSFNHGSSNIDSVAELGTSAEAGCSRNFEGQEPSFIERWKRLNLVTNNYQGKFQRTPVRGRTPSITLQKALDEQHKIRIQLATEPKRFTAEDAFKILNTRYLRLTEKHVAQLEDVCRKAGIEIPMHNHMKEDQTKQELIDAIKLKKKDSERKIVRIEKEIST